MYFSIKVYAEYNGVWGKAQKVGSIFEIFCVKSNLTVCKVTFNCKLQKNWEAGCTSCSPNNFVGEQLFPGSRAWTYRPLSGSPNILDTFKRRVV